jgi:hypothetical protein
MFFMMMFQLGANGVKEACSVPFGAKDAKGKL